MYNEKATKRDEISLFYLDLVKKGKRPLQKILTWIIFSRTKFSRHLYNRRFKKLQENLLFVYVGQLGSLASDALEEVVDE